MKKLTIAAVAIGLLGNVAVPASASGRVESNPCYQQLKQQALDIRRGIHIPYSTLACTPDAFKNPSRLTPLPSGNSTTAFCFRTLRNDRMMLDRGDAVIDMEPISECTELGPWLTAYDIARKRHKTK